MSEYIWAIPSRTDPPDPSYLDAVHYGATQRVKGTKRLRENETEVEAIEIFGGGAVTPTDMPYTPSSGRVKKRQALTDGDQTQDTPEGVRRMEGLMEEDMVSSMLESVVGVLPKYSDHTVWSEHTMQLVWSIAHKFHLIQPTKEKIDTADSSNRDREIAAITQTLGTLTEEFRSLRARFDERPRMTGESSPPTSTHSKANTVVATGPVYRPTKAPPSQPTKPSRPKSIYHTPQPKNPIHSHHQSRLIVLARGEELDQRKLHPRAVVTFINDALANAEDSRHLRVASAHYNHRRNLILMTREDQKGADLLKHADKFAHVRDTLEMTTDEKRYKVRIDGVWTGEIGTVHSPEQLREELEQYNPVISTVKLISPPKWISFRRRSQVARALLNYLGTWHRG
ncbi:hypothetical protein H0H92_006710 [Tricholoma furcatifolium]|nr:hypothetical protein H0H92_006710 [Tricholoma furcatifolium]